MCGGIVGTDSSCTVRFRLRLLTQSAAIPANVEPDDSLTCLPAPSTFPCPEPDDFNVRLLFLFLSTILTSIYV